MLFLDAKKIKRHGSEGPWNWIIWLYISLVSRNITRKISFFVSLFSRLQLDHQILLLPQEEGFLLFPPDRLRVKRDMAQKGLGIGLSDSISP
jgi:hypothetical protein